MSKLNTIRVMQKVLVSATVPHCAYRMANKLRVLGITASAETVYSWLKKMEQEGLAISIEVKIPGGTEINFVASGLAKAELAALELLDVAECILAEDMLPYLPAEYVAKVRAVIAKATGSAA